MTRLVCPHVIGVILILCCLAGSSAQAQTVLYVDQDATGPTHDGASWCTAYTDLQEALSEAAANSVILVAEGNYTPDRGTGDREATFQLLRGVTLEGGYAGCGAHDPDERNIERYETILSGDLAGDDGPDFENNQENSRHVVTAGGCDETTLLDGFIIERGYADGGTLVLSCGAGLVVNITGSPTINRCTFRKNWADPAEGCCNAGSGGGLYVTGTSSKPRITHCTFIDNEANNGGGFAHMYGTPTLEDCTFENNRTVVGPKRQGGAMTTMLGHATLSRCVFRGNSADNGGGLCNVNGTQTLIDCLINGNSADSGGGMYNYASLEGMATTNATLCTFSGNYADRGRGAYNDGADAALSLTSCILWDGGNEIVATDGASATATFSDIQGRWPGEGNLDVYPDFADSEGPDGVPGTDDDDLRLWPGSPCIDTGEPNFISGPGQTDLDGHARVLCARVDMGAYESGIGDSDCDQLVDLVDFADWETCSTGPGNTPYPAGCEVFDFDYDGDVDFADFAGFQNTFTEDWP